MIYFEAEPAQESAKSENFHELLRKVFLAAQKWLVSRETICFFHLQLDVRKKRRSRSKEIVFREFSCRSVNWLCTYHKINYK